MKRAELEDLPAPLRAAIGERSFLYAWATGDGRFVVRDVVRGERARELEWNGRVLAQNERTLPANERTQVGDATVVTSHYFEDETILRVAIEIEGITKIDKQVYDPTPWTLADEVKQAIERARFPEEYAGWPREQKIGYLAVMIHRWRRVHGEQGFDEDEIYNDAFMRDLRGIDPHVESVLADVLRFVGRLEQTDPEVAVAAFTAKTGIRLS